MEKLETFEEKKKLGEAQGKQNLRRALAKKPLEQNLPLLIIDLSFDDILSDKEVRSVASQINMTYGSLRRASRPLSCHLTSLNGKVGTALQTHVGFERWQLGKHPGHFVEVFEDRRHDMIYLSPDAVEVLEEVDPQKIYIIGGIADVNVKKGLTLSRAENFGLQTACLPVKQFSDSNRTVLNVNHVVEILTAVATDGDWAQAFSCSIPTRKLYHQKQKGVLRQSAQPAFEETVHLHEGQ